MSKVLTRPNPGVYFRGWRWLLHGNIFVVLAPLLVEITLQMLLPGLKRKVVKSWKSLEVFLKSRSLLTNFKVAKFK